MAKRDAGDDDHDDSGGKVRMDKWLWAARFFKTRGTATVAVLGGRVLLNGARVQPRGYKIRPVMKSVRIDARDHDGGQQRDDNVTLLSTGRVWSRSEGGKTGGAINRSHSI